MDMKRYLQRAVEAIETWESTWSAYSRHPSQFVDEYRLEEAFARYTGRLEENYPFFHPRYAGQMLKPPHPAAVVGYLAAMLINPNNHALDGGPATGAMEKEVIREMASMFHFPEEALGHLTSSGTIANLEALWIARELHPGKAVAISEGAHYTHGRMSQVLRLEAVPVLTDEHGHIRLDALEDVLAGGNIGTVVLTAGTTGIGAVDPVADVLALQSKYDFRVHIDAAYGGFFTLLAWSGEGLMSEQVKRHYRAIAACDSVAIDPHKHGLQPYGCGCVLFSDASVGRFYKHDSPYTYFTSDQLHLGEISLECSRAGAAAGALWFTLQVLPLRADEGLGQLLSAGLSAAQKWSGLLAQSELLNLFVRPELDIVTFFPGVRKLQASAIDRESMRIFEETMGDESDPVFLSLLRVGSEQMKDRLDPLEADQPFVRILRSVLMKPEHEYYVGHLHERVSEVAADSGRKL